MKKYLKWLPLILLLAGKTTFADEGYSILQVSELTAEEKEFVQEASDIMANWTALLLKRHKGYLRFTPVQI